MLVTQSCSALCDFMNCSPPGFSVHGNLQVRILEWTAIPFSRGTCQPNPGIEPCSPSLKADSLPFELQGSHYLRPWHSNCSLNAVLMNKNVHLTTSLILTFEKYCLRCIIPGKSYLIYPVPKNVQIRISFFFITDKNNLKNQCSYLIRSDMQCLH